MSDTPEIEKQSDEINSGAGAGRGGKRPNAGRKRGSRSKKTIEIQEAAKRHAGDALQALVDVAMNGRSEGARVQAATALLDRGYGRPRQAIEHTGNVGTSGVMIVPAQQDADTWAQQVAQRQAALVGTIPLGDAA